MGNYLEITDSKKKTVTKITYSPIKSENIDLSLYMFQFNLATL